MPWKRSEKMHAEVLSVTISGLWECINVIVMLIVTENSTNNGLK